MLAAFLLLPWRAGHKTEHHDGGWGVGVGAGIFYFSYFAKKYIDCGYS